MFDSDILNGYINVTIVRSICNFVSLYQYLLKHYT